MNLGTLPLLVADDLDLTGTGINVCDQSNCWHSTSFDGPDYGSIVVPDTSDLSTLIPELKQGIPYYVRICASNAMGSSPFVTPYPQFQIPYQHQPAPPLEVSCLASKDGSTLLAVIIGAPFHDGGKMCRPIELITAHSHLYRRDSVSH